MKKLTAIFAAAVLLAAPTSAIAANAAGTSVKPVYSEFNSNDVNGKVIVSIPENLKANVEITLDSPEENAAVYYKSALNGAKDSSFNFELEGYDNVFNASGKLLDGRLYTVNIVVEDTELELISEKFTDSKLSVADGDNNPDSEIHYCYNLSVVQNSSEEPYTVKTSEKTENGVKIIEKNIIFNAGENILLGDVDGDGKIDSSDASLVLAEYARTATGHEATFDAQQRKAADVNTDGKVDSSDASKILAYYAETATGGKPSWD